MPDCVLIFRTVSLHVLSYLYLVRPVESAVVMLSLPFGLGLLSLFSSVLSAPSSYLDYSAPQIPLDRFLSLNSIINPPSTLNLSLAQISELLKVNNLTQSLPNPIVKDFPKEISGTSNTSYFVVPISYDDARAAIPAEYPILTKQIKKAWKDYREDKYPVCCLLRYMFGSHADTHWNSWSSPFSMGTTSSRSACRSQISP